MCKRQAPLGLGRGAYRRSIWTGLQGLPIISLIFFVATGLLLSACGGEGVLTTLPDPNRDPEAPDTALIGDGQVYEGGFAARDDLGGLIESPLTPDCSGIAPEQAASSVACTDPGYTGRWGWRGTGINVGADGPRGVGVHPWGPAGTLSDHDTLESRMMGFASGSDPIGAVGARQAHSMGLDGKGVLVAVLGTQISTTHAELADKVRGHIDVSTAGLTGPQNQSTLGAGIIAAAKNEKGIHGLAYGADLFAISFGQTATDSSDFEVAKVAQALTSATQAGARIFNNSWHASSSAGHSDSLFDDADFRASVADAIGQGAVFVWAAGDQFAEGAALGIHNSSQEAKAALKYAELAGGFVNVVNVAFDETARQWVISNALSNVPTGRHGNSQVCGVTRDYCLSAPGTNLWSSAYDSANDAAIGQGTTTSLAAATVSGGLALLFQAFPYVETSDILQLLFTTADDLGAAGVDDIYGHGMMNLAAALRPSGSSNIPTSGSIQTNQGIAPAQTALLAEGDVARAIAAHTADMVMLDDFDRAFVIGSAGVTALPETGLASAQALGADMQADFDTLTSFAAPISEDAAKVHALGVFSTHIAAGPSQRVMARTIVKEGAVGLGELSYVNQRAAGPWQISQTLGLVHEHGQLFGNQGRGAYGLADQATTVSLGSQIQRQLTNGLTFYGGVTLNETYIKGASNSLIVLKDQLTSASTILGVRMEGLGTRGQGVFALQVGSDRHMIEAAGTIHVPTGRADDGIIVFEERTLTAADLSLLPEVKVSYLNVLRRDLSYAVSAVASERETTLAADFQRPF